MVENNCDINVVLTVDQNETDFSKALRQINHLNSQNYKVRFKENKYICRV